MNKNFFTGLFVPVLTISLLCVAASAQKERSAAQKKAGQDKAGSSGRSLRWEHNDSRDDGTNITLSSKNVEFNDDYTDIERITGDGYFRLSETRGGMARRLEVTPGADGRLTRRYLERGEVRPFDDAARKWLARLLSETVAGSGHHAEARVGSILSRGGADAVLAEIARLKTDYARRVYSTALIEQGNLNGGQTAKLLSQTSRSITSDYEKATLLIYVLKNNLADAGVRAAFFETVNTLGSDYERGRVLAVLFKRGDLSADTLLDALESTRGMRSDFERANVLVRAAGLDAASEPVRARIVEAAHALSSEYERGRVLAAVTKKR
jgi:hypothetical protein